MYGHQDLPRRAPGPPTPADLTKSMTTTGPPSQEELGLETRIETLDYMPSIGGKQCRAGSFSDIGMRPAIPNSN